MLRMTLRDKLHTAWLDSLDYWSGRTTREPGMRAFFTKRLPPIMVWATAVAITVLARTVFSSVFPSDTGYLLIATFGPGAYAWGFIKVSKDLARERHNARPERIPGRVAVVGQALQEAAAKTHAAISATRNALDQTDQLSADLQARLESLAEGLSRTQAEGEKAKILAALSEREAEAITSGFAKSIKPSVQHLDRMGLVYAASGWAAAVLVLVLDHHIPRL